MSDTQINNVLQEKGKPLVSPVKDAALLLGWIVGLILLAGFFWFFTQPARSSFLLKAVNQALEQSGDSRRLLAPVPPGINKNGLMGMGCWYTMIEYPGRPAENTSDSSSVGTKAFVFTFIAEGTFFPCVAVVAAGGKVEKFIPLNNHGEKMIKRVAPEIIKLYTRRIEGAES